MLAIMFFVLSSATTEVLAQCGNDLIEKCRSENGGAKYLKHFRTRFEQAKNKKKIPTNEIPLMLNKGNHYRFNVSNDESKPGKAVLQLLDKGSLLGSSYDEATGKEYKSFDFMCTKTGIYTLSMYFIDGKEGCAIGMVSFVEVFK